MKDNPDFVKIYSHNKIHIIEIFRAFLLDNGVESYVLNQKDSSYLFGDIEVYVKQDDEEKAKELVKIFEENE